MDDSIKDNGVIRPTDNTPTVLSKDELNSSFRQLWREKGKDYYEAYDNTQQLCEYLNIDNWEIIIEKLIDIYLDTIKDNIEDRSQKMVITNNKKAIKEILRGTNLLTNGIDKNLIMCKIQSYVINLV